jgi:mono/diheme cytochrome c family protein
MNYPIWDLPAPGLLIAFVAIVHVFISHFAVGGGLFLVLTEGKARREGDEALLEFVRRHTRFFVLLTLVLGAITGVGIWFTIGLVHPAATSSLINTFVWGWAIEWTFFVVEIAAAMVYYYGWDRLTARTHLAVGWIYFVSAWLSLVVINGILSYMLTPGDWVATGSVWDGILNPTYWPSVVARTAAAAGLAGIYALLTAARVADGPLRQKIARYVTLGWIAPMAVVLPLSLLWFLFAASGAGVPVRELIGAADRSAGAMLGAIVWGGDSGHPIAQQAVRAVFLASLLGVVLSALVLARGARFGRALAAALMASAFVALGAGEWVREDLRKPYVIGSYMLVNGIRVHPTAQDRFTIDALNGSGVLPATLWRRLPRDLDVMPPPERLAAEGRELFRLQCTQCHTLDGYLAIRPLVRGAPPGAIDLTLLRLQTWRGRRMPPLVGTPDERHALAVYLATLDGRSPADAAGALAPEGPGEDGHTIFETNCSMCHGADAAFPFAKYRAKGRDADAYYELLGRLTEVNDMMPAFEAPDAQRRALARYLAGLSTPGQGGGR